jgi:hypothetical protein
MAVAAHILGSLLEPVDEPHQLLDGFVVHLAAFFGGGQLRLAEHARFAVTARPRNNGRRPAANRSTQLNGLCSSLKLITPLLI